MANFVGTSVSDTFEGGADNDTAAGNGGTDNLIGGGGADLLNGGTDGDYLYSAGLLGNYTTPYHDVRPYVVPNLDRGTEADTLNGGDGSDQISAGYGDNVDGGAGGDTLFISFQGASTGVAFNLGLASQTIGGAVIKNVEYAVWIEGGEFNDTLIGNAPVIFGMGGDDSLVAAYNTDGLYGGDGNDILDGRYSQYLQVLQGGAGNDTLYTPTNTFADAFGGDGDDMIYAHGGIHGEAGNDTIQVVWSYYDEAVYGDDGDDDIRAVDGIAARLYGGAGSDVLRGASMDDILTGGLGNDSLTGGAQQEDSSGDIAVFTGASTDYAVTRDAATQMVTVVDLREGSGDGTDTLYDIEALKFTNGTYLVETVLAGGALGVINFVGDDGDNGFVGSEDGNTAMGNAGNDTLSGYGGQDALEGGAGSDLLDGGTGQDSLYAAAPLGTYRTPYYYIPYIIPTLDRDAVADTLNGGSGDDRISAGYGDNVDGGDGTDYLFISFQGATEGVSLNMYLATQTIGGATIKNVEGAGWIEGGEFNDTLMGESLGWGGSSPVIFGMGGSDRLIAGYYTGGLYGGDGDDFVDGRNSQYLQRVEGGAGDDTLYAAGLSDGVADGGDGHDLIYAENSAFGGAGNDTIQSTWAEGGDGDDSMTAYAGGGSLYGQAGNDTLAGGGGTDLLDGGQGDDQLAGGAGNDNYVVESAGDVVTEAVNKGTDLVSSSVSFTLGVNIENLTLTGSEEIDGTGNDQANVITGNNSANRLEGGAGLDSLTGGGGNDSLAGGTGSDTLAGGTGDDLYTVDAAGDKVVEAVFEGYDSIQASVSFTLAANVERLNLTGDSDIKGTGNSGSNVLNGNSGHNLLDGAGGNDTLAALGGNDTYIVDSGGDVVIEELTGGLDVVQATVSYTLSDNVERLILTGSGNLSGTGSSQDNTLVGNDGDNVLSGAGGNDALAGGLGNDTLLGGLGNDTLVVDDAGDIVTELAGEGIDTILASLGRNLSANVENLTFAGTGNFTGNGNGLANVMTGNSGNNWLEGAGGNDTLIGGLGNDTFVIDAEDLVIENAGEGNDWVLTSRSYILGANVENLALAGSGHFTATGNTLANRLSGSSGNNLLDGLEGNDTLAGGLGDDTYVVDSTGDVVTENTLEGTDTVRSAVSFNLGSNLERLNLTGSAHINGTGNAQNNTITGNSGNNLLNGGTGGDRMVGGLGDDTYYVDNVADSVGENHLEGTDTIISSVSYSLFGRAVEILTLTGADNLNATGNSLNNTLTGSTGNNVLDGGTGADKMIGGLGDDTYYVDNTGDNVQELHWQGTDTVFSSVSYSLLGRAVEVMTLTGSAHVSATGNSLNNTLTGNSGNNRLDGGVGNDILSGGLGADVFVFMSGTWKDTVTDFSAADNDMIDVHAVTNGVVNIAMVTQVGTDVRIDLGGGNTVTVVSATQADVLSHIIW